MLIRTLANGFSEGAVSSLDNCDEYTFPLRTWNFSTSANSFLSSFNIFTTLGGNLPKASSVGPNTVKGPEQNLKNIYKTTCLSIFNLMYGAMAEKKKTSVGKFDILKSYALWVIFSKEYILKTL